jgi:predicted transcriptional regulator
MTGNKENLQSKYDGLSEREKTQIEIFLSLYNSIDQQIRKLIRVGKRDSFSHILTELKKKKPSFSRDADYLRMIGDLRNVLVHERFEPGQYLAVPTKIIVKQLESIFERITNPKLVIPTFAKSVTVLSIDDSLADVLRIISEKGFSQFPVYKKNIFKGVLTENGITRWLANHVLNELSLVEFCDVIVEKVLCLEEKRNNYIFLSRNRTVDDLKLQFSNQELLEVVLITEKGHKDESLMGIVTRWDIIRV